MKSIFILLFGLLTVTLHAQNTTFDIATYSVPSGWTAEVKDFAASYVKTNNITKGWCRVAIYKSIPSSGPAAQDYNNEWNSIIVKNNWGAAPPPQPKTLTENGWTSNTATGTFMFDNRKSSSLIKTFSGYGLTLSVVAIMNDVAYMKEVEKFLLSITLTKPEVQTTEQPRLQQNTTPAVTQNTFAVSAIPHHDAAHLATTTFDDGWVAQPYADYVRLAKNQVTVLLHYGIPVTDDLRNTNNLEGTLFDRIILPRYNVTNIRKYQNDSFCFQCVYFYEADVVEKSSGKKYHLGFRVITDSGISKCIEIISPSQSAFQQEFPDQEKVQAMQGYNKFAVTLKNLAGNWIGSSEVFVNRYNLVNDNYIGTYSSSFTDEFTFNTNGTYQSKHKGAYGKVGNLKHHDQNYTGSLTVSNWEITLTKRFEGKTSAFWAQYEAVRGGRVLHLTDKQYSGSQFHLILKN